MFCLGGLLHCTNSFHYLLNDCFKVNVYWMEGNVTDPMDSLLLQAIRLKQTHAHARTRTHTHPLFDQVIY